MHVYRRFNEVPSQVREVVEISNVNEAETRLRERCVVATMNLIRNIYDVGNPKTMTPIVRGLLVTAHSMPIHTMAVGLYPYEQDILPPIATALAYDPTSCKGPTPSVQVLAQSMALIAWKRRPHRNRRSNGRVLGEEESIHQLTARFVTMLRCSYLCAAAGVAFTNIVPVHTTNFSKKIKCASHFIEWLANIIEIHAESGRKLSIVAMGALSNQFITQMLSSFPGIRKSMAKTAIANPASVSYAAATATECEPPIPSDVTDVEMSIMRAFMRLDEVEAIEGSGPRYTYPWKIYSEATIEEYTSSRALDSLTLALVNRRLPELIEGFKAIMADLFSMEFVNEMNVVEHTDDVPDQTRTPVQKPSQQAPPLPPQSQIQPGKPMPKPPQHELQPRQDATDDQEKDKPAMRTGQKEQWELQEIAPDMNVEGHLKKSSLMGQMAQAKQTGQAPTQPVIIITNLLGKTVEITEESRGIARSIVALSHNVNRLMQRSDVTDEDLETIIQKFKDISMDACEHMDQAASMMSSFLKTLDGDIGVMETESQPAAPIIDYRDGSTIRDKVYAKIRVDASRGNLGGSGVGGQSAYTGSRSGFAGGVQIQPQMGNDDGDEDPVPATPAPMTRRASITSAANTNVSISTAMSYVDGPVEELLDILESLDDAQMVDLLADATTSVTGIYGDMDATTLLSNLMIEYRDNVSATSSLPIEAVTRILQGMIPGTEETVEEFVEIMETVVNDKEALRQFFNTDG